MSYTNFFLLDPVAILSGTSGRGDQDDPGRVFGVCRVPAVDDRAIPGPCPAVHWQRSPWNPL